MGTHVDTHSITLALTPAARGALQHLRLRAHVQRDIHRPPGLRPDAGAAEAAAAGGGGLAAGLSFVAWEGKGGGVCVRALA